MHIVKATASLHNLPMVLPLVEKPAAGGLRVVCEIETSTGHTGFGMTGRWLAHGVAAAIEHDLAPLIKGMDIRDFEAIHARLWPAITPRGVRSGAGMAALSCLDMAIWDAVGKASGRSVSQMFGGARKDAPVYVTFGFSVYTEDQLVHLARKLADEGFGCLKVLVGEVKGGIAEDARRIRAVRDAVGDRVSIALDANETLPFDHAIRLTRLISDIDIAFFEDPIRGNDARQLADLRRWSGIPIAVGQFDGYASRFREWIEADAVDILMVNNMYNGGFTETRRVAALSQIYNKPLSDAGGGGLFSLHHVTGFRNGTMMEMHLGNERLERNLFLNVPEPKDGRIAVSDRPGIGLDPNRDVLRESRVDWHA
ncbi:MAG: mandelate racemase/muconate lactonizing enzyme family protein [Hyphomicrobiaceae bacterium]